MTKKELKLKQKEQALIEKISNMSNEEFNIMQNKIVKKSLMITKINIGLAVMLCAGGIIAAAVSGVILFPLIAAFGVSTGAICANFVVNENYSNQYNENSLIKHNLTKQEQEIEESEDVTVAIEEPAEKEIEKPIEKTLIQRMIEDKEKTNSKRCKVVKENLTEKDIETLQNNLIKHQNSDLGL